MTKYTESNDVQNKKKVDPVYRNSPRNPREHGCKAGGSCMSQVLDHCDEIREALEEK